MTSRPLSSAPIVPTTRHKAMLILSCLALSTLGMIHAASAQEATYIMFDPPGSTYTQPNSINREGAIAGYYRDAQSVSHGFLRDRDGTITTFDPPGSTYTYPASINRVGAIAGTYNDAQGTSHGFLRTPDGQLHLHRSSALERRRCGH
jgi:hypothetical protein